MTTIEDFLHAVGLTTQFRFCMCWECSRQCVKVLSPCLLYIKKTKKNNLTAPLTRMLSYDYCDGTICEVISRFKMSSMGIFFSYPVGKFFPTGHLGPYFPGLFSQGRLFRSHFFRGPFYRGRYKTPVGKFRNSLLGLLFRRRVLLIASLLRLSDMWKSVYVVFAPAVSLSGGVIVPPFSNPFHLYPRFCTI